MTFCTQLCVFVGLYISPLHGGNGQNLQGSDTAMPPVYITRKTPVRNMLADIFMLLLHGDMPVPVSSILLLDQSERLLAEMAPVQKRCPSQQGVPGSFFCKQRACGTMRLAVKCRVNTQTTQAVKVFVKQSHSDCKIPFGEIALDQNEVLFQNGILSNVHGHGVSLYMQRTPEDLHAATYSKNVLVPVFKTQEALYKHQKALLNRSSAMKTEFVPECSFEAACAQEMHPCVL